MADRHVHRPGRSREARSLRERSVRCYTFALGDEPRARGNVCYAEFCTCGAVRLVNTNAGFYERGPWIA
jgi:hypothetical protein